MADLAKRPPSVINFNFLNLCVILPSLVLVYLTYQSILMDPEQANTDHALLRNYYYLVYTAVFTAIGLIIMFRRQLGERSGLVLKAQEITSGLIIGLIITSSAYSLARIMYSIQGLFKNGLLQ